MTKSSQSGSVLIVILLFSSLLAGLLMVSWRGALLHTKMVSNYKSYLAQLAAAEISLETLQNNLTQHPELGHHLGWVANLNDQGGVDYYEIHSDKTLTVRLKAIIALYRDETGGVSKVLRKTWEETRD